MLFQTSVIGSLPRPAFVRDLLSLKDSLSSSTYNERLENVIRFAIALQETAGIDVVSDGEWRRISYLGVITELANGFTVEPHPLPGTAHGAVFPRGVRLSALPPSSGP